MRLELCIKLNFILLSKTNSFKSPERHWRNSDSVFDLVLIFDTDTDIVDL